jgi:hypothetical protein
MCKVTIKEALLKNHRKAIIFLVIVLLVAGSCKKKKEEITFHIGIVSAANTLTSDSFLGARELVARYGAAGQGGIIRHITYPDNFTERRNEMISSIIALADDPLMKAIIMNQALPGAIEAFRVIHERRPDIMLFACEPHEDLAEIEDASALVVSVDFISRGFLLPWAAKQMGADTFVHISFPRHMAYASLGRRMRIIEAACKDLGLRFVYLEVPDPTSDVGAARTLQYITDNTRNWVEQYGQNAVFYCTNDAQTEPLLRELFLAGGMFVEADIPSPFNGYPAALGVDLSKENGNWSAILKRIETAVVSRGGAGRFGTWRYAFGYVLSAGVGEFAKRVIEKKANLYSAADFFAALSAFTPDSKWNGIRYTDPLTGLEVDNHFMVYMDTYIFGLGSLRTTEQIVPQKYFEIK